MITRTQKLQVGAFMLVFVLLVAAMFATFYAKNALKHMIRYMITTTLLVSGLNKSVAVNYLGVNVGKVEIMEF